MPITNTPESVAGPMPSPHRRGFLPWIDTVESERRNYCVKKRSGTTYYIDPVGGSDGANGTSAATAWKTCDNVRTLLAASCTNTTFLFKRGTVCYDHTGMSCASASNTFYTYGPNADNFELSTFNVNLRSGIVSWTLAATGRYTTSVPSVGVNNPSGTVKPSWIRKVNDPLNPFTYVDSTAKVEATPYSFYIDGSNVIHLNPGSDTPGSTDYEAVPYLASPPNGISLASGSDGSYVEGFRFSGWGCQIVTGGPTSGITFSPNSDEVVYCVNCESYYNGRHAFSQLGSGTKGGTVVVENCIAGYCAPIGGYSTFNSYSNNGGNETHFINCLERFSCLPVNASAATPSVVTAGGISSGNVIFAHSGRSDGDFVLYVNRGMRIGDERANLSRATTSIESFYFADGTGENCMAGTAEDVSSYRFFIIDWQSPRTQIDTIGTFQFQANARMCFINCRHYIRHNYANAKWWLSGTKAIWLNSIFEFESMQVGTNLQFFTQNSVISGVCPRFLNCAFIARGSVNSNIYVYLGGTSTTGMKFGNCLFVSWDKYVGNGIEMRLATSSNQTTTPSVQNDTASLRYCATVGCRASNTGNDRGFDSGLGMLNLETANTGFDLTPYGSPPASSIAGNTRQLALKSSRGLARSSPLASAGSSNPFPGVDGMCPAPEFGINGEPCDGYSIGPNGVFNTNVSGGVVSSMVGSMILGD